MNTGNKKGFTLVELVVVIAIIGVLAAILVPTLMNYVKKSRLKTANSNAKLIYTSASNASAMAIADGETPEAFFTKWPVSELKTRVKGEGFSTIVCHAVADALKDNGDNSGACALQVSGDGSIYFAQWATRNSSAKQIVGQYPDPPKDVETSESIKFGGKYTPGG